MNTPEQETVTIPKAHHERLQFEALCYTVIADEGLIFLPEVERVLHEAGLIISEDDLGLPVAYDEEGNKIGFWDDEDEDATNE